MINIVLAKIAEHKKLYAARRIMREDFFSPVPHGFSSSVLRVLNISEEWQTQEEFLRSSDQPSVTLRGWIVSGIFILFSLSILFLGVDFRVIAESFGRSFMLPIGITVGCIITVIGALCIGSHLETLREKFVHYL